MANTLVLPRTGFGGLELQGDVARSWCYKYEDFSRIFRSARTCTQANRISSECNLNALRSLRLLNTREEIVPIKHKARMTSPSHAIKSCRPDTQKVVDLPSQISSAPLQTRHAKPTNTARSAERLDQKEAVSVRVLLVHVYSRIQN